MATNLSNAMWVAAPTLPPVSGVVPYSASDGQYTWNIVGQSADGKTMVFGVSGNIIPGGGAIVTAGNTLVAPVAPGTASTILYVQVDVTYAGPNDRNSWRIQVSTMGTQPTTFMRGTVAANPR